MVRMWTLKQSSGVGGCMTLTITLSGTSPDTQGSLQILVDDIGPRWAERRTFYFRTFQIEKKVNTTSVGMQNIESK